MMAFHEVGRETVRAPKYATRAERVWNEQWKLHHETTRSTKTPTGEYTEKTFVTWRCGNCRALAVGSETDSPPKKCDKCHC